MEFFCDQCHAQYRIADEKVGSRGVRVKCKKCTNVILVKPVGQDSESASSGQASTEEPVLDALAQEESASPKQVSESVAPTPQPQASTESDWSGETRLAPVVTSSTTENTQPSAENRAEVGMLLWYVVEGEAQVGPLSLASMHQKWEDKRIDEESLAWRDGMPDWAPIAEIPEFSAWIAQRPQQAATPSVAQQSTSLAAGSELSWKPSAASALSSLMQEELLAASAPKPVAAPIKPENVPDLLPQQASAQDPFSAQKSKVGGHEAGTAWSMPQRKRGMGALGWAVGGGVVALGVLGLFVARNGQFLGYDSTRRADPAGTQAPQTMASTPPGAGGLTHDTGAAGATTHGQDSKEDSAAAQADASKGSARGETAGKNVKNTENGKGSESRHRSGHAARVSHKRSGDEAVAQAPTGAVKASLTKEDIWGVVVKNASKVTPCIKNARARNEIPAGRYTFILDWVIRPDGAVVEPQLKGPDAVMNTSLEGCFASALTQWHFPASQNGAPIANFPFGPVTIP